MFMVNFIHTSDYHAFLDKSQFTGEIESFHVRTTPKGQQIAFIQYDDPNDAKRVSFC